MKTIHLLSICLLIISSLSCSKTPQLPLSNIPIPALKEVTLKNGRLHFPSYELLVAVEKYLHREDAVDLNSWYADLGFVSQQNLYFEINEAYSKVNNRTDYNSFEKKYADKIHINKNNSLLVEGYHPFLAPLLNTNAELYIGENLIKYTNTHKITILDGNEIKLAKALQELKTETQEGIIVEEFNFHDSFSSNARGCSSNLVWQDCYYGTHERIWGRYEIANDIINTTGLVTHTLLSYPLKSYLRVHIQSEFKGFLGIWYLKRTRITWSIGWMADYRDTSQPSFAHGTGWTVDNLSIITYYHEITNISPPIILVRPIDLNTKGYRFGYCYVNLETYNINCSESC